MLLSMHACLYADALQLMINALNKTSLNEAAAAFNFKQQYIHQDELYGLEGRPMAAAAALDGSAEQQQQQGCHFGPQWALLKFDQPVTAPEVSTLCLQCC